MSGMLVFLSVGSYNISSGALWRCQNIDTTDLNAVVRMKNLYLASVKPGAPL